MLPPPMALTSLKSSSGRKEKSKSSKRKLERKINLHAKVDAVIKLGAKKTINKKKRLRSRQKKLKAYDLSALSELLPDLDVRQPLAAATNEKLNCKSRKKLVQREGAQLQAVLNNPTFQMDPITAIQHHLELTQPTPPPVTPKKKRRNKPGSAKRKAKKGASGTYAGSQSSMDI